MAKGVYRSRTEESGAEYAAVDYGTSARLDPISRKEYEAKGYQPEYTTLPTQEEYERTKGKPNA